jgi:hypothetical protein
MSTAPQNSERERGAKEERRWMATLLQKLKAISSLDYTHHLILESLLEKLKERGL